MPFVDAGGFQLHYRLDGDASRPAVVLSNSLGADLSMWDAQMDALLETFRVLRYDTRGHGMSGLPDKPASLAALGQDLLTLMDALEIERAHACGVSMGGMTAMWLGIHAAERFESLVLSNTAAKIGTAESWNGRIAEVQANGVASIADAVLARWFTSAFQNSASFAHQRAMLLGCSAEGYTRASGAIRDADLRGEIASIPLPTLVISGQDDPVTPPSDGHALQAAIPGSIFRQVPGAHLSNIEYPAEYNAVLLCFLQESRTIHER
jgi:3-oxoadipate enol-lactonase